ncbi:band 4.1-like protein 3 isoform X25 [Ambystoma mexicanum]|uniref:band 4.1-like protein 3 isoform X25 n=1 Tax=Ambystoma mexicanum TaxID=8296 RepID=UPI0037E7EC56
MTSESGSDSESKQDQDKDPQEASHKKGAVKPPQQQPPPPPQPSAQEEQDTAEQFPAAAAHSTPLKSEKQNGGSDDDREAAVAKQIEYQQFEDDKISQKSSSSKLSKSPLKLAKKPKSMQAKVTLLDGSEYTCDVEKRSRGQVLFDKVCEHLNLLEKDYFGLTYRDSENQKNWLDPSKEIKKQVRSGAWHFSFNVKFYPPDPSQLSEDITRYYLCLQLRDDIVCGRLPCSFVTVALLGAYTVQSELGDYETDEYGSDYVSDFQFAPNQTKELEDKVIELHKSHRGMTPAEAEVHFLENAKKLSMYGVDLHHAKDSEGVEIMLGVCASGLLIYRDRLRINRFAWPKVLKISYKRNNFYIKIRPGEFEQFESTIGFKLPNHRAAKRLWKVCVEHHTFFRLLLPETPPKKFLTLGSKFRYSGRTQAQTRRASALIDRPAPYFERSSSKRYTMSRSLDGASVNENHDMYMKDSVSAAEVGTGPYSTTKGISQTNLITTVTPEKKVEEERDEEEEQDKRETPIPVPVPRPDTKTDSERTDTAADGETTATESDQEEDADMKAQESDKTQEEFMKHQTNISELKRTFLETSADSTNEWEKRLSTSPVRLVRHEEAPMIEPLVPDETKEDTEQSEKIAALEQASSTIIRSQQKKETSGETPVEGSDVYRVIESSRKPIEFLGGITSTSPSRGAATSPSRAQVMESKGDWESSLGEVKQEVWQQTPDKASKVTFDADLVEESRVVNVHASREAAGLPGVEFDAALQAVSAAAASSVKGMEGSARTEEELSVTEQLLANALTNQRETAASLSHMQEEPQSAQDQVSESVDGQPLFGSPVVKVATVSFGGMSQAEKFDISSKEVPVVHTETKTITYESSEVDPNADSDPGILMSAQTITSETTSTTTTTHITKTVKGGISETRIEKRIVITGDADIDHDQE